MRSLACPGLVGGEARSEIGVLGGDRYWDASELKWCRASGLAPGKRQQASAVQGLRLAFWERGF